MDRRKFLGFSFSLPFASRVPVNELPIAGMPEDKISLSSPFVADDVASAAVRKSVLEHIEKKGIPSFLLAEIAYDASSHARYGYDADLHALKSMSPANKARIQKKRNVQRAVVEMLVRARGSKNRNKFIDAVGKNLGLELDRYHLPF